MVDAQRAFARVLMKRQPGEADLRALGGARERWLLYREMVRARMKRMIASGIPRTVEALGETAYADAYDAWLDVAPPRTRYIREIVPAFVDHSLPRWDGSVETPWLSELARLESARWEVAYFDTGPVEVARELSFDRPLALNPTLRVLKLSHAVHKDAEPDGGYAAKSTVLLVYRRHDDHRTGWWTVGPVWADIIDGAARGEESLTELVKAACAKNDTAIDPPFVQRLGTTLASFIERTIVLGSL